MAAAGRGDRGGGAAAVGLRGSPGDITAASAPRLHLESAGAPGLVRPLEWMHDVTVMPVSTGCYAAPLGDCDGGPLTREHFFSEALLEQFGSKFYIEGAAWSKAPHSVSPKSLASKILCEKHNGALGPLDKTAAAFYRVLRRAHEGEDVGAREFVGEHIERWALKSLLGAVASGAMLGTEGRALEVPPLYLRVLYGLQPVADGCGLYYVDGKIDGFDADLMDVAANRFPEGDPEAGNVFGVTIRFLGFQFVTTVATSLTVDRKQRLFHRPDGFQLGSPERGRVALTWNGTRGNRGLILKMQGSVP